MPENVAETFLEHLLHPDWLLPPMYSDNEAATAVIRLCETNEGATFSLYFGDQRRQPLTAVGLDNSLTIYLDADSLAQELQLFIAQHRVLLQNPRCCLGVWRGVNADGVESFFLDLSVLVYKEVVARNFAVEGDQIAIFYLATGVEVETGGTGLPVPDNPPPEQRLQRLAADDRLNGLEENSP